MLTEHSRSWTHQWKMEGMAEGRQEGAAAILQSLLARKFGPLHDAVQQCVKTASSADPQAWSLNILDAASLSDVFGD